MSSVFTQPRNEVVLSSTHRELKRANSQTAFARRSSARVAPASRPAQRKLIADRSATRLSVASGSRHLARSDGNTIPRITSATNNCWPKGTTFGFRYLCVPGGHPIYRSARFLTRHQRNLIGGTRRGQTMSVSVSVLQLKLLVVAIVLVMIGQLVESSIGNGRAASPASIAEPSATASIQTRRRPQEPATRSMNSAQVVRHSNLARRPNPSAHDLPSATLATLRPSIASAASTNEHEEMSNPNRVNTIRVLAPRPAPPLAPETQATAGTTLAPLRNLDAAIATIAILADTYDETRMSLIWPGSPPSTAPPKLAILFGTCSSVAISIYGLVAFKLRRRRRRAGGRPMISSFVTGNLTRDFASSRS